jgi:hypothetical protein
VNRNVITAEDAQALAQKHGDAGAKAAGGAAFTPPAPPAGTPTADDYWNRLLKYIPIEVIGVYLAASDAVASVTGHTKRETVLWIIFGVVLAVTPIYLRNVVGIVRPRQLIISAVAFAVWAFALGGPFAESWSGYESWMGALAIILSAFVFGALKLPPLPKPEAALA